MRLIRLCVRLCLVLLILGGVAMYYAHLVVPPPQTITYGVSFNTPYVRELGLDWQEVYTAILDDLGVRHLRLAAHWPMVEPDKGTWNFAELDTQVRLAEEHGATVVLAVGRRLPRWPECHVPLWAQTLSWEEQKEVLRTYIREVVDRYKESPAIEYWQVENEPFLGVYAREECGDLDRAFLAEEVSLVRSLDPSRPVLVTDSGNLGQWYGAYRAGDVFGTSVYVHLYNEVTGPVRTILPPETYVAKRALMRLLFGEKDAVLIELSIEPWLSGPIAEAPIIVQTDRMGIERFDEIIEYARRTRFDRQYLWGAEWWYWMKQQGHPEYWERARTLYRSSVK